MDTHERSVATTSALTVVVSATVSKNWLGAQCVDYTDDGGIGDTMHANKVKYPFMACLAPSLAFLRFRHVFFSLKLVLEQLKRYREQCEAGWNCMRGCKDR